MNEFIKQKFKSAEEVTEFLKNPTIILVNGYVLNVVNETSYKIFNTEGVLIGEKQMVGGEHMFISQIVTLEIEILELKDKIKKLEENNNK